LRGQHGEAHSTDDNQILSENVEDFFKSIKKQAKQRTAAEKGATKIVVPPSDPPTVTLTGRQARVEERFRELAAWYILQGVDEATARRRAQDEIDDDPRKD
jgi:hypothetical protein